MGCAGPRGVAVLIAQPGLRLILAMTMLAACTGDDASESTDNSLQMSPRGGGPRVAFDLSAKPFPLIPLPNDVATVSDPTSRTGRRVNLGRDGTTTLEARTHEALNELEGWGTSAPITVPFQRPAGLIADETAIDTEAFAARHVAYDFRDDAIYVVDLASGTPALLEVNHGHFPIAAHRPQGLGLGPGPSDPQQDSQTLLFETRDEAPGRPRLPYNPFFDSDFDGVIDKPNSATITTGIHGIDDVLTWYERETDTIILKPVLPLAEKREYAVVLTDRLVDGLGQPVRSPFPQVYHPFQRAPIERLQAILRDGRLTRFFGDLAGTGLAHVAFAWSFTTGPQSEDLRLLRDGLSAAGPFAWLADAYKPVHSLFPLVGRSRTEPVRVPSPLPANVPVECRELWARPYTVSLVDFSRAARGLVQQLFGVGGTQLDDLMANLAEVDHFVVGTFASPQFFGDPALADPFSHFRVNYLAGTASPVADRVKFWLTVPKKTARAKQPFPVAVWNSGTGLPAEAMLFHAGAMARQGIALGAFDLPSHGLVLGAAATAAATSLVTDACLAPMLAAFETSRARDTNDDGVRESGGDAFSLRGLHGRDVLRQGVVDELQFIRVLRAFDGKTLAPSPYVQTATKSLAGDFDGDGVVDIDGAHAPAALVGQSFGAAVAQLAGAVDEHVKVAVAIAGTAGLADGAGRSVSQMVAAQLLTPILVTVRAEDVPPSGANGGTRCAVGQRSLRFVVSELSGLGEVEVACVGDDRAPPRATFVVRNLKNGLARCARSDGAGLVHVPIATSAGDPLSVEIYRDPSVALSFATCALKAGASRLATVNTWEVSAAPRSGATEPSAAGVAACSEAKGCQQFHRALFPVGSRLTSPQDGLGLRRQTPELRRFLSLLPHLLDAADPANYAQAYVIKPMNGPLGRPMAKRALLNVATLGDDELGAANSVHFARIAGAIPFIHASDASRISEYVSWAVPSSIKMIWGKSPDEILREKFVLEGVSRFWRTPAGTRCSANEAFLDRCTTAPMRSEATCRATLYDPDFIDESRAGYDQQRPVYPLRMARDITIEARGDDDLVRAFRPRTLSKSLYTDAEGVLGGQPLLAHVGALMSPTGQHSWEAGNACQAFDAVTYYENLIARFVATGGTELLYLSRPGSHGCLATNSCDFLHQ